MCRIFGLLIASLAINTVHCQSPLEHYEAWLKKESRDSLSALLDKPQETMLMLRENPRVYTPQEGWPRFQLLINLLPGSESLIAELIPELMPVDGYVERKLFTVRDAKFQQMLVSFVTDVHPDRSRVSGYLLVGMKRSGALSEAVHSPAIAALATWLTADKASVVKSGTYYLVPFWNPAVERAFDKAVARNAQHRDIIIRAMGEVPRESSRRLLEKWSKSKDKVTSKEAKLALRNLKRRMDSKPI